MRFVKDTNLLSSGVITGQADLVTSGDNREHLQDGQLPDHPDHHRAEGCPAAAGKKQDLAPALRAIRENHHHQLRMTLMSTTGARHVEPKGVYFLANDVIYDLAVAFLKSFRIHNPSWPLCLIPFDDNVRRLSRLSEIYGFSTFDDAALFARCAELSKAIHNGDVFGHYRKLAAWHGPFEEFVYIDSDTVVTSGVAFVHDFLRHYGFVFSNSNFAHTRKWVWKDSIYSSNALSDAQIDFAANTGFFCSTRHAITIDDAELRLPAAMSIVQHMELRCIEQPFLNYLVVTSGKPFSSISKIMAETPARHFPVEKWGGERLRLLRMENCCTPEENVLLVHWAGEWQPTPRQRRFYRFIRRLGYHGPLPQMRLFMRNWRLWRYYRYRPEHLFVGRYQRPAQMLETERGEQERELRQ